MAYQGFKKVIAHNVTPYPNPGISRRAIFLYLKMNKFQKSGWILLRFFRPV